MLFDSGLLFFHATGTFQFTAGEFVSLVGSTTVSTSAVINLGNARDLGIGPGEEIPQLSLQVGTAITSSSASMTVMPTPGRSPRATQLRSVLPAEC